MTTPEEDREACERLRETIRVLSPTTHATLLRELALHPDLWSDRLFHKSVERFLRSIGHKNRCNIMAGFTWERHRQHLAEAPQRGRFALRARWSKDQAIPGLPPELFRQDAEALAARPGASDPESSSHAASLFYLSLCAFLVTWHRSPFEPRPSPATPPSHPPPGTELVRRVERGQGNLIRLVVERK